MLMNQNRRRVRGNTNRPVCGYSVAHDLFLHMHSMAFPDFNSLQPSPPRSSNPTVTSATFQEHFPLSYQPTISQHKVFHILHFPQATLTTDPLFSFHSNPIHQTEPSTQLCPPLNFVVICLGPFLATWTHLALP